MSLRNRSTGRLHTTTLAMPQGTLSEVKLNTSSASLFAPTIAPVTIPTELADFINQFKKQLSKELSAADKCEKVQLLVKTLQQYQSTIHALSQQPEKIDALLADFKKLLAQGDPQQVQQFMQTLAAPTSASAKQMQVPSFFTTLLKQVSLTGVSAFSPWLGLGLVAMTQLPAAAAHAGLVGIASEVEGLCMNGRCSAAGEVLLMDTPKTPDCSLPVLDHMLNPSVVESVDTSSSKLMMAGAGVGATLLLAGVIAGAYYCAKNNYLARFRVNQD